MPVSFIEPVPEISPEISHLTNGMFDEHVAIKKEKDEGRENVSVV